MSEATSKTIACLALLFGLLVPLSASAQKSDDKMTEAQTVYMDYLLDEGYRPKVDSDGDVTFKFEGGLYYIDIDEDDDQYFRLVYPAFWEIEDEGERRRALAAVEVVNRVVKTGKISIYGDSVYAAVENFLPKRSDVSMVFDRSLGALQSTRRAFVDEMNKAQ